MSSKRLTSDFIHIGRRRVGPNAGAEKRRKGLHNRLNRAVFYTLIGSLLQYSCLFISRPVNNPPASISVILHLSLTLSPFPHPDFLTVLLFITFSQRALTRVFPPSHLPLIRDPIPSVTFSFSGLSRGHLILSLPPVIPSLLQSFSLTRHHSEYPPRF